MSRTFRIVPGSALSRRLLTGLGAFCLLESAVLTRAVPTGVASLATIAIGGLLLYVAWSTRHVRVVLSAEALRIQGDIFGRSVARAALQVAGARLISLDADADHRPTLRTCGTALPGYLAGWFRLKNREKALLFVTDRTRVVYLPTTQGYALLLSVAEPEEFLEAL